MLKLGINLTRTGSLIVNRAMSSQEADVLFETLNNVGIITLNRPKALNSLNTSMVSKILPQLQEWESNKALVIVKGAGEKAFCAGGDVKVAIDKVEGPRFFRTEYSVNQLIGRYKIPYVAFIDGITMGGGIGMSVHGRYRVATEKTMLKLGINLTRTGSLIVNRAMSSQEADVLFETLNNVGIITLNRPKALNSLNTSMVSKILPQLQEWESNKALVIVKGAGEKAFCAGGDVKVAIDKVEGPRFFRTEYSVNQLIGRYKIPYVAFIDGITMGGGIGMSVHGRYRVATEKTVIAMPETKIGLFPDVGGSYFLPRLPVNLGLYLGLTGDRLKAKDVVKAGIATHFVSSRRLYELEKLLSRCSSEVEVDSLLNKFNEEPDEFSLAPHVQHINYCFAAPSIEEVIERLEKTIHSMCPGSLKITLKALQRGAQLELAQYKDNNPQWNPRTLADVTDEYVESYFKKLPDDKELVFPDSKL
ncbi:3-hydroxyisobutyryl-coenzyme A hydrolase [Operophtera brumata]|uniref:3-hydroxyisobutyryl-CoA hydrolase, mitochondrial n=1 Tax=Operophtera brumata TaxID=104452 RepID=A0A0L7KSG9_OPEBR|nr:3-hydroxyisobutyryl-coenzyme A hydrolase [Operophtera brumata]